MSVAPVAILPMRLYMLGIRSLAQFHPYHVLDLTCLVWWHVCTQFSNYVILVVQAASHRRYFYFPCVYSFPLHYQRAPLLRVGTERKKPWMPPKYWGCMVFFLHYLMSLFKYWIVPGGWFLCRPSSCQWWFSPVMCELLPLLQMFCEAGEGFRWVLWPHHLDHILFQVGFSISQ